MIGSLNKLLDRLLQYSRVKNLPIEVVTVNDGVAEYEVVGGQSLKIDRIKHSVDKRKIYIYVRPNGG